MICRGNGVIKVVVVAASGGCVLLPGKALCGSRRRGTAHVTAVHVTVGHPGKKCRLWITGEGHGGGFFCFSGSDSHYPFVWGNIHFPRVMAAIGCESTNAPTRPQGLDLWSL